MEALMLKELKKIGIDAEKLLEIPPNETMGDFALPCFKLAKAGESPVELAGRIRSRTAVSKSFERVETKGPYVNFFLSTNIMLKELFAKKKKRIVKKKIIIEHTSVNPGKPWHIGHSRNALLGDAISKCYRYLGYNVEVQNYIDNLGRQVAVTTWAYDNVKLQRENMKLDLWQGMMYAEASKIAKENAEVEQKIVQIMKLMEEGGNAVAERAKKISVDSVKSQLETAKRLGIYYDLLVWESDIVGYKLFDASLKEMMKSERIYKLGEGEDKGCIVVDMSLAGKEFAEQKKPYKIIVRSNGVPTYTGKDIAYQLWKLGVSRVNFKYKKFLPKLWSTWPSGTRKSFGAGDAVINIIGYEQEFPQKVVKEAVKIMGHEKLAENSHHLSYKHIVMPEGRFSGRSGNWVGKHADEVIGKVVELAEEELKKRNPKIGKSELQKISEIVGIGAFKFFVLKFDPNTTITFEWDKLLDFDGYTSVYVQYSGVRAKKILQNAKKKSTKKIELKEASEKSLIKYMLMFNKIAENVVKTHKPHILVEYTYNLANKFSDFYAKCRVVGSECEGARVKLVKKYIEVLTESMGLLGIEMPDYL